MGLRDVLKDVALVATITAESRRAAKFVTDMMDKRKKDPTVEIEALKLELRKEQQERQNIMIAIREHQDAVKALQYPRNLECDAILWKHLESAPEPNAHISKHKGS